MTFDRKVQCSRIAVSPGSHGVLEFDDHTRIEELAQSHEGLQGVVLHKSHGVRKFREGGEIQNVIKIFILQILATVVGITCYWAIVKIWSSDNGARRVVLMTVSSWGRGR